MDIAQALVSLVAMESMSWAVLFGMDAETSPGKNIRREYVPVTDEKGRF
jgi:hypothetical protein